MLNILCSTTQVRPGEWIDWTAVWNFSDSHQRVLVGRLAWQTFGKGDDDWETAIEHEWTVRDAEGKQSFRWKAPRSPNSFAGKLIKLHWYLELECKSEQCVPIKHDLIIGPSPELIRLPSST